MSAQAEREVLVTADELSTMDGDGVRRELVDGVVRTMAPAGFEHGDVAVRFTVAIAEHVRARRLGVVVAAETGFRLSRDPDTVRAPDAAFVAAERLPPPGQRQRFLELAPDFVVEVVSPSDRAADVVEKALAWLSAGTSLVWVAYPALRLVVTYEAGGDIAHVSGDGVLRGEPVLPGLALPVAELFDA